MNLQSMCDNLYIENHNIKFKADYSLEDIMCFRDFLEGMLFDKKIPHYRAIGLWFPCSESNMVRRYNVYHKCWNSSPHDMVEAFGKYVIGGYYPKLPVERWGWYAIGEEVVSQTPPRFNTEFADIHYGRQVLTRNDGNFDMILAPYRTQYEPATTDDFLRPCTTEVMPGQSIDGIRGFPNTTVDTLLKGKTILKLSPDDVSNMVGCLNSNSKFSLIMRKDTGYHTALENYEYIMEELRGIIMCPDVDYELYSIFTVGQVDPSSKAIKLNYGLDVNSNILENILQNMLRRDNYVTIRPCHTR